VSNPAARIVTLLVLAWLAAGCGTAASGSSSLATENGSLITRKVPGRMRTNMFAGSIGDKQALRRMRVTKVYCGWAGGHVVLHAIFHNQLGAHVTVHVTPTYRLRNAGQHGDGVMDGQDVGVDAKSVRAWVGDLGSPAGVSGSPRITKCLPELSSIDLG
jgi:hypothetical protein